MVILFIILAVVVFIVLPFINDMNSKNKELAKVGGIRNKYKELISSFDDFDLYELPKILQDDTNMYVLGWSGYSSIFYIRIFEVLNNVHIILEILPNKESMKRDGLNQHQINKLTLKISKKLEWKFPNTTPQSEIIQHIGKDMEVKLNL